MKDSYNTLIKLILPESIEEYFELTHTRSTNTEIHLHLKKLNTIPEEYKLNKLVSKGFFDAVTMDQGKKCLAYFSKIRE